MADGDSAYEIMRLKSLGITNWNLAHVPIYSGVLNCEESIDCMIGSIEAFTDFEGTVVSDAIILGQHVQAWSRLEYSATRGVDGRYPWTWTVENLIVDGVVQTDAIEAGENCRSVSYTDLIEILEDAKVGNYSTDASATVICEDFDSV